jgi:hypothetical protein
MKLVHFTQSEYSVELIVELLEPKILDGKIYPDDDKVSRRWTVLGKLLARNNNIDGHLIEIQAGYHNFPGWLGTEQQFKFLYVKNNDK